MPSDFQDPMLFGHDPSPGLVAVEHEQADDGDHVVLYHRRGEETDAERVAFRPFIVGTVAALGECPVEYEATPLRGKGRLNLLASFATWKDFQTAKSWLAKHTGLSPSAPGAPCFVVNDPVQQYLMLSGKTHFMGMPFGAMRRLQLDIECRTTPGYTFCNADREGDAIIAIALADSTGWREVLSGVELDEKAILERLVECIRERDPDVIEGHNIFNFDLSYIARRARLHRVKLSIGRDRSVPVSRPSRMNIAERTIAYRRFAITGRHIIDTLFLVQAYDVSNRSLPGYGLKQVAVHFGLAPADRTYIPGPDITRVFDEDPERLLAYVGDDILETAALSELLSQSSFTQAQMLPLSYQNVGVKGAATKIDALLVREYLQQGQALPIPEASRSFTGGYTDMFETGVIQDVHHCDVRSLYPSLMLTRELGPTTDELGVFLKLLGQLKTFRLEAKAAMQQATSSSDRAHYDALQSTFKILINSFYGYLGFAQGRFNDYDAAEKVTGDGRELLKQMIDWLNQHGAQPVEIDTDGIYFVPPSGLSAKAMDAFRSEFVASLPEGIELEFDGEYRSMYSYKMKNYALLSDAGEITIKGAALKSRGLEPFQRDVLRDFIRLMLEGREREVPELKASYAAGISDRAWPIERLAKTETLQDSPRTYADKLARKKRSRAAAYELALASTRDFRAGDQLSYYVTGNVKSVAVHGAARLTSDWDPDHRDENVAYYLAKLDALYKKFAPADPDQGQLSLF